MSNIFSIVPVEVLQDRRLTLWQTRVLIALLSFRSKNTDTVWPSRKALSERCGGMDLSNISKVTSDLVKLGWLIKVGNGGRSKSNTYKVIVPELETVEKSTTDIYQDAETVAESTIKTVAESTTGKELTKELTIKTNARSALAREDSSANSDSPDIEIFPEVQNRQLVQSWEVICQMKKVPINQQLCDRIREEAKLAGISVSEALAICRDKNWAGFKNSWLENLRPIAQAHKPIQCRTEKPTQEQWQQTRKNFQEFKRKITFLGA